VKDFAYPRTIWGIVDVAVMFHGIFKSTAKLKILYMKMLAIMRHKDKSLVLLKASASEVLQVLG
jgi:hypothetical protein